MKNNKKAAVVHLKHFDMKEEDVDGISFSIDEDNTTDDHIAWNFTVMKMNKPENREFISHELGYKYQILLYKGEQAELFEAILGDVKNYVKRMVEIGQEGIILKKCDKSEEMMNKILRGKMLEALAKGMIKVAESKEAV